MTHSSIGHTGSMIREASGDLQSWQKANEKQAYLHMVEQERDRVEGKCYTLVNDHIS